MTFKAGDVVSLKSGGQALTVTEIDGEMVMCIWLGEEGDLFRERIPAVALEAVEMDDLEGDEGEEDGEEEDEEDDEDEEEGKAA